MNIGFTGSRSPMTVEQQKVLTKILETYAAKNYNWFLHGDCVGSDSMAHQIAKFLGYKIKVYPPINDKARAYCKADELMPEEEYITRNHLIVNDSNVMIATPDSMVPKLRSGTWATIRYSQAQPGLLLRVIYPNGSLS